MGGGSEGECVRLWVWGMLMSSAFSSFPDTSLFTEGDIQFSFKIRHVPAEASALAYPEPSSPTTETSEAVLPQARRQNTDTAAEYREWNERGREWLYGFVWFQQRRDRGVTRGYMQVSDLAHRRLMAEIGCHPHATSIPCALECSLEATGAIFLPAWVQCH